MSQQKKPKEFWIDLTDCIDDDDALPVAFLEHPQQGPLVWQSMLIHVIEYSAYESQRAVIEKLEADNGALAKELQLITEQYNALKSDLLCHKEESHGAVEFLDVQNNKLRADKAKLAEIIELLADSFDNYKQFGGTNIWLDIETARKTLAEMDLS